MTYELIQISKIFLAAILGSSGAFIATKRVTWHVARPNGTYRFAGTTLVSELAKESLASSSFDDFSWEQNSKSKGLAISQKLLAFGKFDLCQQFRILTARLAISRRSTFLCRHSKRVRVR